MDIMETARALAGEGKTAEAAEAYTAALQQLLGKDPEAELEAALYLLQFGEDYKLPYTCLYYLYQRGFVREDILAIMEQAFYAPNVKLLKKRYEKNCKLLAKYPYLFRKDFIPFEDLPLCFFPYEDGSYYPLDLTTGKFVPLFTPKYPVISRNFFEDLENPILADDVFSQYELEYLYDNVRKSEWVARENHIYLHYTNWSVFCAYLQVLDMRPILEEKKIVFLVEEEINRYPIDFKAEYGIDYTQYSLKPVGIKEVTRLIWHAQLTSHNGGDFFNEVFDEHPNLISMSSMMLSDVEEFVQHNLNQFRKAQELKQNLLFEVEAPGMRQIVAEVKDWTAKDVLVGMFLNKTMLQGCLDLASRITPVLFFQPHFRNRKGEPALCANKELMILSEESEAVSKSPIFKLFKYKKTFVPMRRPTNSYAAAVRFSKNDVPNSVRKLNKDLSSDSSIKHIKIECALVTTSLVRSFMADPDDPTTRDSVIVRFEDGKLNPKATFSALAKFLDLPYTESMTYCSFLGQRNPETTTGNTRGFDPSSVYRIYEEYANDEERCYFEYCLRDAYRFYGYDFHYYDGKAMSEERAQYLIKNFTTFEKHFRDTWPETKKILGKMELTEKQRKVLDIISSEERLEDQLKTYRVKALSVYRILSKDIKFVNKDRKLLRMIPLLKLDPALLETELYH